MWNRKAVVLLGMLTGCTASSFDVGGPLGDECEGAACLRQVDARVVDARPPVDAGPPRDEGPPPPDASPPPDEGVDRGVDAAPADLGVDAAVLCDVGETRPCGTDEGPCQAGTETCEAGGVWGACLGGVQPLAEACDGLDNDCDGTVDEEADAPCGPDVGACEPGTRRCVDGALVACEGGVGPAPEGCNALDDDCDGAVDEEVLQACEAAEGVCAPGVQACGEGAFGACEQPAAAEEERCDGGDNDCDGMVDEGLSRPCGSDVGACQPGEQACLGLTWSLCEGGVGPADELCDGEDNDCDGVVDEGLMRACGSDVAPCEPGVEICADGVWGACEGGIQPLEEACDGADNDCDGTVDEGLGEVVCGGELGECRLGVQRCVDGAFGACEGGVEAIDEDCNGLDDDCDGSTDEALERPCGFDQGICQAGIERCIAGGWGACEGGISPLFEICNGLDDDCDGRVDVDEAGNPAGCFLERARSTCVDGACDLQACERGWLNANGDPSDGCERGCALFQALQALDPVVEGSPIRVRTAPGAEGAVFLRGADAASARLALVLGAATREVGDPMLTYVDGDLAFADPGWVVAGLADGPNGRIVTWSLRDPAGGLRASDSQALLNGRQVAIASQRVARRFLVAMVASELRAVGRLEIVIGSLDQGMGRPIGPITLADSGVVATVRPLVFAVDDGFIVLAVRDVAGAPPRLSAWYINALNNVGPEQIAELPGAPTGLGGTLGEGIGRVIVQAGPTTFIQDISASLARPGFLASRLLRPRLAGQDHDLLFAGRSWVLTWLDSATQRPVFGLLDDELTDLLGPPADLLPDLRDPVTHLHLHGAPDSALARVGVTTGVRGRVGAVGCR